MQGLPQKPTTPEPDADKHPSKGRCVRCGQPLRRLWLWELGRWLPDKWCSDECYQAEQQREEAAARAEIIARRKAAEDRRAA